MSTIPEVATPQIVVMKESNYPITTPTKQQAIYHLEFLTFPLIANDSMDLITLQQWVAEGAKEADSGSGVLATKIKIDHEEYEQLKQYIETNNLPQGLDLAKQAKISSKSRFFEIKNRFLYKKDRRSQSHGRLLKVTKKDKVETILYLIHNHSANSYFGTDDMFGKVKELYYWPQMYECIHTKLAVSEDRYKYSGTFATNCSEELLYSRCY
ncbi:13353_t:CDS:2 [Dentiscutata erythropus]|uniref:13353_t:CDS:1 n=1 Tax=Dentiscutata erythropus TaxID=1348616 RepID=A0A9N9EJ84_9GLOM|nr:13353_t:CDS:2 [Dentiscutata erythropus]